jgi:hypothetical protein
VDREFILAEIRRTAADNGGTPLGRARFAAETGIRESDWSGRYWARWNDALRDAGFRPNQLQARYDDDEVLAALIAEVRRLGRMPTTAELRLRRREDPSFPSAGVFAKYGRKADLARRLVDYCDRHPGHDDVVELIPAALVDGDTRADDAGEQAAHASGFVYLLKSGRFYKIGHTLDVGRRRYELAIQLPEPVKEIHVISTDDPLGIERYWHARFSERRRNGEWFELTRADVTAFKRRKFM